MIWRSVVDDSGMKNKKYNFLSDSQTSAPVTRQTGWKYQMSLWTKYVNYHH